MSHTASLQTANAKPQPASSRGILLQRKCACGGSAGLSGECEECGKKRMLGIPTKLAISQPGDRYEQEADRIADQVMATPGHSAVTSTLPRIQRFASQPTGQTNAAPASVDQALASPGRPLEPALQRDMEQRFGYDFSRVRVHTDGAAERSARDVNAHAYTVGHDIVFGMSTFASGTNDGRRLLAHELTHVLQQRGKNHLIQRETAVDRDTATNPPQLDQTPDQCRNAAYNIYRQCVARCRRDADSWACALPWRDCPTEYIACVKECSEKYEKALDRCTI